jgi:hypothetical protein
LLAAFASLFSCTSSQLGCGGGPSPTALLPFNCVFRPKPLTLRFCILLYGFSYSCIIYAVLLTLLVKYTREVVF